MNKTATDLQKTNPGIKDPKKGPLCPYCNQHSILRPAQFIYFNRPDINKNLWVCSNYPTCDAYVGTHDNGAWQNFPLGRLANRELRDMKHKLHTLFDHKWKSGKISRGAMYIWLQKTMSLSEPYAHIGELDQNQCDKLMQELNKFYVPSKL